MLPGKAGSQPVSTSEGGEAFVVGRADTTIRLEEDRSDRRAPRVTYLDQAVWTQLRDSSERSEFVPAWLVLQCHMIGDVRLAVAAMEEADGDGFAPVAIWPEAAEDGTPLGEVAEFAMNERRGVVQAGGESARGGQQIAYPFIVDDEVCGVVAMEIRDRPDRQLRAAMRQLQWGVSWIEVLLRRERADETAATRERVATALDLIASALEQRGYQAACTAVATELATRLECERVSVGLIRRGHCRLAGMSHSAEVGRRMNLVRAIEQVMDECADQRTALHFVSGAPRADEPWVTRAHAELSRQHGALSVLSVPLISGERAVGAIVFEHAEPGGFDARRIELADAVGVVVGPILEEKRANDRLLIWKAVDSLGTQLVRLLGPGHVGRKLVAAAAAAVVAFFAWYHTDYRVTADAALEGAVQRSIGAPYDGYLYEAAARPGDIVRQGDVLARLDDRDLIVERLGRLAERRQLELKRDASLAAGKRAEVNILDAQIRQVEARIALLQAQLSRAVVRAPYDGVVVSGDLSQDVGAALKRGDQMFELAPLDDYRLILYVDERDIDVVAVDQVGTLRIDSLPDVRISFTVERITPVAETREGRNTFRVEGRPELAARPDLRLLPGMEGTAKVSVGERRLIWIWTRRAIEWARLAAWRWLP